MSSTITSSSLGHSMPTHFRFLDLPLELRGMIYDLVLTDEICTVLAHRAIPESASSGIEQDEYSAATTPESPEFKLTLQCPSILAVSHQTRAEAIPYYQPCTFCIDVRPLQSPADDTLNVTIVFKRAVTEALPYFLGSTAMSRIQSINLIAGPFDTEHTAARKCYKALDSVLLALPRALKEDGKTTTALSFDAFVRPPTRSVSFEPRDPDAVHPQCKEALDQSKTHLCSDFISFLDFSDGRSVRLPSGVLSLWRDCSFWHYKAANRISGLRKNANRFMDL